MSTSSPDQVALGYGARVTPHRLYTSPLYWKAITVDWMNFIRCYDLPRIRRAGKFLVKDAGINAIYAMDLQAMEKLAALMWPTNPSTSCIANRPRRLRLAASYRRGA